MIMKTETDTEQLNAGGRCAPASGSRFDAPPDHFVCAGCGETSGEWGHWITEDCIVGPKDSRADMLGEYECNHCGAQEWVDPANAERTGGTSGPVNGSEPI